MYDFHSQFFDQHDFTGIFLCTASEWMAKCTKSICFRAQSERKFPKHQIAVWFHRKFYTHDSLCIPVVVGDGKIAAFFPIFRAENAHARTKCVFRIASDIDYTAHAQLGWGPLTHKMLCVFTWVPPAPSCRLSVGNASSVAFLVWYVVLGCGWFNYINQQDYAQSSAVSFKLDFVTLFRDFFSKYHTISSEKNTFI